VSKPKRRRTGLPPAPSCANVPASHAGTIGNRKAGLAAAAMSPDGTFRTRRWRSSISVHPSRADIVRDRVHPCNCWSIEGCYRTVFTAVALLRSVSRETRAAFSTRDVGSAPAGQLERSNDGSSGRSRVGSKGVRSVLPATPSAISSARASPVAGALRMPHTLWPVAT
jgi:hypothetical protein